MSAPFILRMLLKHLTFLELWEKLVTHLAEPVKLKNPKGLQRIY